MLVLLKRCGGGKRVEKLESMEHTAAVARDPARRRKREAASPHGADCKDACGRGGGSSRVRACVRGVVLEGGGLHIAVQAAPAKVPTHLLACLLAVAPVAALEVHEPVELGVRRRGLRDEHARQRAVVAHRLRVNNQVDERQLRRAAAQLLGRRGRVAGCSQRGGHSKQHEAQHPPCWGA